MKQIQAIGSDFSRLAEDAHALLTATADLAGEKVNQARERLATTLESGKNIVERAKARALESAKATNEAVRDHPYQAIGIAFGMVALLGYLFARRLAHKG